jgi:hypothetical protein
MLGWGFARCIPISVAIATPLLKKHSSRKETMLIWNRVTRITISTILLRIYGDLTDENVPRLRRSYTPLIVRLAGKF